MDEFVDLSKSFVFSDFLVIDIFTPTYILIKFNLQTPEMSQASLDRLDSF